MITKPLTSLTEADLLRLINEKVPESKQIEYKRELPDGSDKGTVNFLRAVTAFANTQGGDLLYGIEAKDGIPVRLSPLTLTSNDQILQKFENLCRDGVEPRLTGVQYHFVSLKGGGSALVVRIPKSWSAPHRVSTGNHAHFYGRNSAGAYQLDVAELRQAFTLSDTVVERIRSFRANRLLALGNDEAPIRLKEGAMVVLHVIPLQAMISDFKIDIVSNLNALQKIYPLGASGWNQRINLDGRLSFRNVSDGRSYGYAQLFRNGIIEAVIVEGPWNSKKIISGHRYEENIISALRSYFPALDELGIAPPAYLFLSLLGVKDCILGVNENRFIDIENNRAERDNILLPEIAVEQWTDDPVSIMRPVFDMVWNAFGFARSFNYNDAGQWIGQR